MKLLSFLTMLTLCVFVSGQTSMTDKLKLVTDKYPDIAPIGVVFNSKTTNQADIPNSVAGTQILKVPIKDLREVAPNLNAAINKYNVKAFFLVDDGGKLTTASRTVKYVLKTGLKKGIKTFSDADNIAVKVTGRIKLNNGQMTLEIAEDQ